MVVDYINIQMGILTKVNFLMILFMVKELSFIKMVIFIRVILNREKWKGLVHSQSLMVKQLKVNGKMGNL
jgi:hypothetical protein